jgi:hypothetical protein
VLQPPLIADGILVEPSKVVYLRRPFGKVSLQFLSVRHTLNCAGLRGAALHYEQRICFAVSLPPPVLKYLNPAPCGRLLLFPDKASVHDQLFEELR